MICPLYGFWWVSWEQSLLMQVHGKCAAQEGQGQGRALKGAAQGLTGGDTPPWRSGYSSARCIWRSCHTIQQSPR